MTNCKVARGVKWDIFVKLNSGAKFITNCVRLFSDKSHRKRQKRNKIVALAYFG